MHPAVHRDGDHRRARPRRRAAPPALQRRRAPGGAAAGRQRTRPTWPTAPGWAQQWGYDEINLNCGCPSERVQRGAFGACLMAEPQLGGRLRQGHGRWGGRAGDGQAPHWHRQGHESYEFVRDFVGTVASGLQGVHRPRPQRLAQGPVPKENREVPPLRYELVHRLKTEFPHLTIAINGGITTSAGHRATAGSWTA
jgi:tRNA-dihydrouridine synthase